jgi:hypothetical protein
LVNVFSPQSVARRALMAFALMTASTMPVALAAGSANAQLVVGVTVVRSCVVDAQAASSTSSRLKLSCAAGAASGLRMNRLQIDPRATRLTEGGRATEVVAPTSPASSTTSQGELRVLTLDF